MSGINIDIFALDSEQSSKIVGVAKVLTEYLREMETVKESMKETIDQLIIDLSADKESAKDIKKHVKLVAKVHFKQTKDKVLDENAKTELLLERLSANLVDDFNG